MWTGAAVHPGQSCGGSSNTQNSAEELERNWLWLLRLLHLETRGHESVISSVSVGLLILYDEQKGGLLGSEGGKMTPALMCWYHVCDHPAAVWSTKPSCCFGNRRIKSLVARTRLFRISRLCRWWVVLIIFCRLSLSLSGSGVKTPLCPSVLIRNVCVLSCCSVAYCNWEITASVGWSYICLWLIQRISCNVPKVCFSGCFFFCFKNRKKSWMPPRAADTIIWIKSANAPYLFV